MYMKSIVKFFCFEEVTSVIRSRKGVKEALVE